MIEMTPLESKLETKKKDEVDWFGRIELTNWLMVSEISIPK